MLNTHTPPRPAGLPFNGDANTVADCLRLGGRPGTPERIAKWRRSTFNAAGQRVIHPGSFDDLAHLHLEDRVFGAPLFAGSDHVEHVMRHPGVASEASRVKLERAEDTYKGKKREPLGKSYLRGHQLPPTTRARDFRFGKASADPEGAATVIFPGGYAEDELTEEARALYMKSHGCYEPGEQRRRGYRWPTPAEKMVFPGDSTDVARNGASESIRMALQDDPEGTRSRVTSKRVEDYKRLTDSLGRVRNLGQGSRASLPRDHAYGQPSVRRGELEWDAKQCLQGAYTAAEQAPDVDLGTTIMPGFRNITTETRAFGVPSIRSDIPRYARRSLADRQNYGDDVSAQFLLYPAQFAELGVEDDDFLALRDKQEIREIFEHIDMSVPDAVFEEIWARATSACDPTGQRTSVDMYRKCYNEVVRPRS